MRSLFLLSLVLFSSAAWAGPRHPAPAPAPAAPAVPATPYDQCEAAIAAAEKAQAIPSRILPAIGRVESGRVDPATGRVRAWPWAINVEGQGHWYESKEEVIAAVQELQARGVRSIDVGCMQVNLMHHPDAFASLDAAFDPVTNAAYGAHFLAALNRQTGSWPLAVADYHSATPELGIPYQQRVMAGIPGYAPLALPAGAGAFAAVRTGGPAPWPPTGTVFAAFAPESRMFGAFAPPQDLAMQQLQSGRKRLTLVPGPRRITQVAELPFSRR